MRKLLSYLCINCVLLLGSAPARAQSEIRIEPPSGRLGWLTHTYEAPSVPPVRLANSSRLASLIHAGNLYLTAPDVVALAIENNIDVEVQRYTPLLAKEILLRARAGGFLRSVGLGLAAGPSSVSLSGVTVNATGAPISTSAGVGSSGGVLTQLGPSLLALDPTFFMLANYAHNTSPQNNTFLTGTTALVTDTRTYEGQYVQNWDFGLTAQFTYVSTYAKLNSADFNLNPYDTGFLDLQVTQNLLQGLGPAVNGRNIRVQKNNIKVSDLQFKQQVITTVTAVLNLYWDLISFREDVRARQREVDAAQQLLEDNRRQVNVGSLAEIEVTRAQSQLYTAQQDLTISQTNLTQQETILKNAISRNGVANADLAEVHIIPLDNIPSPTKQNLPPIEDLVRQAVLQRPEVEQNRINLQSNQLNLVGIKNGLKPQLQAFGELTNNALAGALTPLGASQPGIGYLAGDYGNLLAQIARRNYPSYSAGLSLSITLRNRAAQADYVTSLLEIRQNELNLQKSVNQVRVDVQNAVVGLQQAQVRYDAAVKARELQEQTLDADQKKSTLGATTVYQVVQDQRDLASSVSSEVQAMANYSHARIALEQAMGTTLEDNGITVAEALSGHISRPSQLPANLPAGGGQP